MNKNIINFSLWVDYIEKTFVDKKLKDMINEGSISGATSNPSIFKEAFSNKDIYMNELASLSHQSSLEKYELLAISEIKRAAQAFRSIFEQSETKDGYVSIEINPFLANDYDASVNEGKRLFNAINEPNVMIKVPATNTGYSVISELLKCEIPVNATLVFSPMQAMNILQSVANIENRNKPLVISVFVSRFDRLLNDKLPKSIKNMVGIMNAALIYDMVLKSRISNVRTLFASTGVKSAQNISNDYYISNLLAPNSINTAPLAAIEAFNIKKARTILLPMSKSLMLGFFNALALYVDINEVYEELMKDGMEQFEHSFSELLESL